MYKQFKIHRAVSINVQPKKVFVVLAFTAALVAGYSVPAKPQCFIRGDFNADGFVNAADTLGFVSFILLSTPVPPCADAADMNDDGVLSSVDIPLLFSTVFSGSIPPPPFPGCGLDPTPPVGLFPCLTFRADMNYDGIATGSDVVRLLNFAFLGFSSCYCCADVNCDGILTGVDVVLETNFAFLGTPLPPCPCPSI
jgi:hypothetical protein